jgi:rod shape-determining protein MreD
MKVAAYVTLVLLVIPVQIVLLDRISIAGIRPDLALVTVCLIGLYRSEVETVLAGLAMGFAQDLFSGGALWGNLCLKPVLGLMAGLARRNLVNLTWAFVLALMLGLSLLSGSVMYLLKSVTGPGANFLLAARGIILPQACYDAVLGLAALKLIRLWKPRRTPLTAFTYE